MSRASGIRWAVLIGLVGLGAVLRSLDLEVGLWLDELITVHCSRADGPLETFSRIQAGLQINDPLFYVLVNLTTGVLGESELTVRLPALIPGILLPAVAFFAVSTTWGRRAGAVALTLAAVHPRLLYNSHVARPYPLAELCLVLAALGLARALATGRARDRLLAWAPALVAVYTHKLFLCVLPALALAPLLYTRHYTRKRLLVDVSIAFLLSIPLLQGLLTALPGAKTATFWVSELTWDRADYVIVPLFHLVVLLGVLLLLVPTLTRLKPRSAWGRKGWDWLWDRSRVRLPTSDRALIGFFVLVGVVHAALLGASTLRGAYMLNERYTTPLSLAVIFLLSRWISRWPRLLAAIALLVLVPGSLHERVRPDAWVQEWRELGQLLDAQDPGDSPVLLWTNHAESDLVISPGAFERYPQLRGLLECPLVIRPGQPDRDLNLILLPLKWYPQPPPYFENVVVPPLEDAERFYVVAHPGYAEALDTWLKTRLPSHRATLTSRVFRMPLVVLRYERAE